MTTPPARRAHAAAPIVQAEGVHKWFGELEVLRGVDIEVEQGDRLVIIGPSGSGKSTFLRCLNHLEPIDAGSIRIDGQFVGYEERDGRLHELSEHEIARRRARIGMVFQHFNLFGHMTALQNVIEAPRRVRGIGATQAQDRGHQLLARMGLADKASAYPAELSGGQQQRVAIARALAMDPLLMLFDEPTSALDPELVGEVLDVIEDLAASGMTMVVVTHEIQFAREVGSHLAVMDGGRVIEYGDPATVLTNPRSDRARSFLARVLQSTATEEPPLDDATTDDFDTDHDPWSS